MQVTESGARTWILRVKVGKRRPDIGLGGYPTVTLEQARAAAREVRAEIAKGIDPIAARRARRDALALAVARQLTFDEAAKLAHKARAQEFSNPKHVDDWLSSLTRYASPKIGALPVAEIDLPHVLSVLEPEWATKTETMTRVRQRIESVLAWATVNKYRTGDNPARWKGNLEHALPRPSKVRKKTHQASLPWQRMGEFMAELRRREGMGAKALEFLILTAARSSEVRLATWSEIDLKAKLWTCPPEHMKARKAHRVPITEPAVKLLERLPRMEGSEYVFPAVRGGALSDMTIAAVVKRMHEDSIEAGGEGFADPRLGKVATPHGFRSSFKDWCRSSTAYPDEVSELALAHVSSDATRAAYARDELLPQRTKLMREWAR